MELWKVGNSYDSLTVINHPEGIANAAISGDGNIIWAVTGSNRLLRLTLATGQLDEILPPLPATGTTFPYAVPGSAFFITGKNFSSNVSVVDNGVPLPIISMQPAGLYVQIPWDAAPGIHQFAIRSGTENAFEAVVRTQVSEFPVPNFVTNSPEKSGLGQAKAAHQDFESLVTPDNPAKAGEIIHVYLTGLGALDNPLPTGAPSPASPLSHPLIPFACTIGNQDAPVLYVGYAVGLTGFYQADLLVPSVPPLPFESVFCKVTGSTFLYSSTALIYTTP